MGWTRMRDLAVKTGEYEKDGETKSRYENVGSLWKNDDGDTMLSIKRTFNPAGVPNPDNRDSVLVSMFEPRSGEKAPAEKKQEKPKPKAPPIDDDDIPF